MAERLKAALFFASDGTGQTPGIGYYEQKKGEK
jgi:hypothetical protein